MLRLEIQSGTTSVRMNSGIPCTVCGGGCTRPSHCKSLGVPPDGFYTGGGGGHQHDDDCEDAPFIAYWQLAQIYSKDDESLSKQQETASWRPRSPSKPSSVAV
jgi:hypothetical protein